MRLSKLVSLREETKGMMSPYKEHFEICEYTTQEELEHFLSHCSKEERQNLLLIAASDDTIRMGKVYDVATLGYNNDSHFLSGVEYVVDSFEQVESYFLEKVHQRYHQIPWTIAETKRCIIRELCMEDFDALFELYKDKELTKYTEPLLEYEEELNKQRAYIDHMYRYFGYGMWLVFLKDTGELIGRAGLENRQIYDFERKSINSDVYEASEGKTVTELGYLIKRKHQGKGLATEVCQAILQYAQEELEIEELNCFIEEGNTPSIKLAESLGFSYLETIMEQDRKMLRFIRKSPIIKH